MQLDTTRWTFFFQWDWLHAVKAHTHYKSNKHFGFRCTWEKRKKKREGTAALPCEAVDVVRLCCHAAVLWQCQMNFCPPIPWLVFKLACGPRPFLWACRLLGNTSISSGCDAVCLPPSVPRDPIALSLVSTGLLMSGSWTSAALVIKERSAISTLIFFFPSLSLSLSICPRLLCSCLLLPPFIYACSFT